MIDIRNYGAIPNGVIDCIPAINAALLEGDILIKNGTFLISESIKIPSNRTVYGENAILKSANASYDNLFRNSDFVNGNVNINIIGLGNFVLDANTTNNNDSYTTYGRTGNNSYRYVGIQIHKVTTFQIKNIYFKEFNHHAIHLAHSSYGTLSNIYFSKDKTASNQDGIDLLWGSHHINMDNINGYSGDDFVAIFNTNHACDFACDYSNGYDVGDVHDITLTNVIIKDSVAGRCPAIIGGGGNKIYDINFSDIVLHKSGALWFNYNEYGDQPSFDDIYNITIDTVTINSIYLDQSCLEFAQSIKDSVFSNITNNSGKPLYRKIAGTQQNVSVNGATI